MAKRKRGLASYKRRRRRRNPAPESASSGIVAEATEVFLPALGGYVATKLATRLVYTLVQRRMPKLGKHAGALAGVASFGAAYYFAGKVKQLRDYEQPIIIGSAIAAGAAVARTYFPKKYAWVVADYRPEDVTEQPDQEMLEEAKAAQEEEMTDALDEFDYLEREVNAYRNAPDKAPAFHRRGQPAPAAAQEEIVVEDDFGDMLTDVPDDDELFLN